MPKGLLNRGWHPGTACWPAGPALCRRRCFQRAGELRSTSLLLRWLLVLRPLGKSPFPFPSAGDEPSALPSCVQCLLRFLPLIGYPKFKIYFGAPTPPPPSAGRQPFGKLRAACGSRARVFFRPTATGFRDHRSNERLLFPGSDVFSYLSERFRRY
uniref:Uncharacterized protein n=1 Tax=Molossus molossus TaxID=27622 RepID=A0A7J8BJR1_MOLMO|nr:hypothetical protein HJG59_010212 [Molossus molossus]